MIASRATVYLGMHGNRGGLVEELIAENTALEARTHRLQLDLRRANAEVKDMRALCDASADRWEADGRVVDFRDPWTVLAAEHAYMRGTTERPVDRRET